MPRALRFFFLILIITPLILGGFGPARAQQTTAEVEARRAQLQAELEAEERAIAEQIKLLQAKQRETATVAGEITLLKNQIARAQASIKAKKVAILRLEDDIIARQGRIEVLDNKITAQQKSLAELLRQTREVDAASVVEIILASDNLSEFFRDVDDFAAVQRSLHELFAEIRETKELTEQEKRALEEKKNDEIDAQKAIEYEQALVKKKESERQQVLAASKSEEYTYEQILKARQKRAAEIRSALFALRDTAAIPFGRALEYANQAAQKTGIRAAFLLGVIKQESDLGANVGQCFLRDTATGAGVGKNTGTVFAKLMKPDRDVQPFLRIAEKLGFDPYSQVVSCAQAGGYGGAMGPAQFIPSTWVMYEAKLQNLLGKAAVNPWDPEDAFMASAVFLSELGAAGGSYSAEREAAARYYAGGAWATRGLGYADSVLAHARDIQLNMIDPLQNN